MLETRNPVEVITTLRTVRTSQRLLAEETERLSRSAASQADYGDSRPTERYRVLQDTAADLRALAAEIAAEAECT